MLMLLRQDHKVIVAPCTWLPLKRVVDETHK
jgi:hypothetical protein